MLGLAEVAVDGGYLCIVSVFDLRKKGRERGRKTYSRVNLGADLVAEAGAFFLGLVGCVGWVVGGNLGFDFGGGAVGVA